MSKHLKRALRKNWVLFYGILRYNTSMNAIDKKRNLGQFFTTNSDYILQGFGEFVKNKEVSDPFAGNQDLLDWSKNNKSKKFAGFDCDKNYIDGKNIFFNDSINSPKDYKFVCTNPPHLIRYGTKKFFMLINLNKEIKKL